MNNAKVTGVRAIELGVTDLNQSAAFYSHVWGLEPVVSEGDTIHLRANGAEHHIVTLRERPKAGMLGVHFAAPDRERRRRAPCQGQGLRRQRDDARRASCRPSAGGGYGFQFQHAGRPRAQHRLRRRAASQRRSTTARRPMKLSHVVLNSAKIEEQTQLLHRPARLQAAPTPPR